MLLNQLGDRSPFNRFLENEMVRAFCALTERKNRFQKVVPATHSNTTNCRKNQLPNQSKLK